MAGARRCCRRAPSTYQPACKPGSVRRRPKAPRDGHSSGTPVARRLQQPTRTTGLRHKSRSLRHASSLFGLAPGGVCRAVSVAGNAVRSYRTFSPLPSAEAEWRFLLCGTFPEMHHACARPLSPDVIRHRMSMEPGLSSRCCLSALHQAAVRPTDRRGVGPGAAGVKCAARVIVNGSVCVTSASPAAARAFAGRDVRETVDARGAEVALERRDDHAGVVVVEFRDRRRVAEARELLLQFLNLGAAVVGRERAA